MPTRRLVVALTLLLVGVFGVGLVTALSRGGDDPDPTAGPSPTSSPTFVPPLETVDPTPDATEQPTPEPTTPTPTAPGQPTTSPAGGTGGPRPTRSPGGGPGSPGSRPGGPSMPNTGAPAALALAAATSLAVATAARRLAR